MAEAARAAAVKPTQRVLFRAASRVEAPARPGAAKPLPPLVGRRRVPAQPPKPDTPELNVEVGPPISFVCYLIFLCPEEPK